MAPVSEVVEDTFSNLTGEGTHKSGQDIQGKNEFVQHEVEIHKSKESFVHVNSKSGKRERFEASQLFFTFLYTLYSVTVFCQLLITYMSRAVEKVYFVRKDSLKPHISEKIGSLAMPDSLSQLIVLAVGFREAEIILLEILKGIHHQTHGYLPDEADCLKMLTLLENIVRKMAVTVGAFSFQDREATDENINQNFDGYKMMLVFWSNYINCDLFLETSGLFLDATKCGVKGQILSKPKEANFNSDVKRFSPGLQIEVFKEGYAVDCLKDKNKRKNFICLHDTKQDGYKGTADRFSRAHLEVHQSLSNPINDEEPQGYPSFLEQMLSSSLESQSKDISDINANPIGQSLLIDSHHNLSGKLEKKALYSEHSSDINNGRLCQEQLDGFKFMKLSLKPRLPHKRRDRSRTSCSQAERRDGAISCIGSNNDLHCDHNTVQKELAEIQKVPAVCSAIGSNVPGITRTQETTGSLSRRPGQPADRVPSEAADDDEGRGESGVEAYRAAFDIESEYNTSDTTSFVSSGIIESDQGSNDEQEVSVDASPETDSKNGHTVNSNHCHDGQGDGYTAIVDQGTAGQAVCTDDTGERGSVSSTGPSELETSSDEGITRVKIVKPVQASSPGTSSVFTDGNDDDYYSSSGALTMQPQRDEDHAARAGRCESETAVQVQDVLTRIAFFALDDDHSVRRGSVIGTAGNAKTSAATSNRPACTVHCYQTSVPCATVADFSLDTCGLPGTTPLQASSVTLSQSENQSAGRDTAQEAGCTHFISQPDNDTQPVHAHPQHPYSQSDDDDTYPPLARTQLPPMVVHRAGDVPPWATKTPRLDLTQAHNLDMLKMPDRLASYHRGWPEDSEQDLLRLSLAGFYYTGHDRDLRCWFCGATLTYLNPGASPMVEHAQLSPDCQYLQEMTRDLPE